MLINSANGQILQWWSPIILDLFSKICNSKKNFSSHMKSKFLNYVRISMMFWVDIKWIKYDNVCCRFFCQSEDMALLYFVLYPSQTKLGFARKHHLPVESNHFHATAIGKTSFQLMFKSYCSQGCGARGNCRAEEFRALFVQKHF